MARTAHPQTTARRPIGRGTMIGRYKVQEVLSSSEALGVVVRAKNQNGAWVTLTLLDDAHRADTERLRTTLKLVRTRAALQHPGLIQLRGPFQHSERVFYATAASNDGTLADRLRGGVLEPAEAGRLIGEVAAALELAAASGLIHRDLKPAAIQLAGKGRRSARLGDFGVTRPPGRGCERPELLDGVEYRSPEELRGEPAHRRSSVYSLACILAECLTGKPPYRYERPLLTVHAHTVEPVPRLTERRPSLPAAIDDVLARALAKDPRERFRSPAELAEAVTEAIGEPVEAPVADAPRRQQARKRAPVRERRRVKQRRRRRLRLPRLSVNIPQPVRVSVWAGAALVASAAAGFASGNIGAAADTGNRGAPTGAVLGTTAERPAPDASLQAVSRAVTRLDARRERGRRQLGRARSARRQAAAAGSLAAAYRDAGAAVSRRSGSPALVESLGHTARAYAKLAAAARAGNARRWTAARRTAVRGEKRVTAALKSLQATTG